MKKSIIRFDKGGFEGVVVGCLEVSLADVDDLLRCAWVHGQRFGGENPAVAAPVVYWHAARLICTCMTQAVMEKKAFVLHIPFLCFASMPEYRDTLLVPNLRPEASIPIIKVVPKLLKDVFDDVMKREGKEAEKTGKTKN